MCCCWEGRELEGNKRGENNIMKGKKSTKGSDTFHQFMPVYTGSKRLGATKMKSTEPMTILELAAGDPQGDKKKTKKALTSERQGQKHGFYWQTDLTYATLDKLFNFPSLSFSRV